VSAALIASHIAYCTHVRAESIGSGGPDLVSTAACRLEGHEVIVDCWSKPALARLSDQMVRNPTYYAYGATWTAFLSDFRETPSHTVLQMQIERVSRERLRSATAADHRRVPLPRQRGIIGQVAKILEGHEALAG
jgi:hypothetical protein